MMSTTPVALQLNTQNEASVARWFLTGFVNRLLQLQTSRDDKVKGLAAGDAAEKMGRDLADRLSVAPETLSAPVAGKLTLGQVAELQAGLFPQSLLNDQGLLDPAINEALSISLKKVKGETLAKLLLNFTETSLRASDFRHLRVIPTISPFASTLFSDDFSPRRHDRTIKFDNPSNAISKFLSNSVREALRSNGINLNIVTLLNNWIKLQKYKSS